MGQYVNERQRTGHQPFHQSSAGEADQRANPALIDVCGGV